MGSDMTIFTMPGYIRVAIVYDDRAIKWINKSVNLDKIGVNGIDNLYIKI